MKPASNYRFLFILTILFAAAMSVTPQKRTGRVWTEISESSIQGRTAERQMTPNAYRVFRLDKAQMRSVLAAAPQEFTEATRSADTVLSLPMPDGSLARFSVQHSPIVEPGLAAKFPELDQTYLGQGIDDPTATVRFDLLPSGFHSMVLSPRGTVMVDPYASGDTDNYIAYFKRDAPRTSDFSCGFDESNMVDSIFSANSKRSPYRDLIPDAAAPEVSSGTALRTYRLALAATGEYTAAAGGGTVAGALAAQVVIMNRVDGVYERDLAIRMVIIANNNLIVYTDGATDPYTNNDGSVMLGENQSNLDSVIGSGNYDIGHVFSTGGGGIATVAGPCGSTKARGVTGLSNPTGDAFAIDYVAHEMGHQWGAQHSFNGTSGNCGGGNRSAGSAFEPGSGITIMAYAGICNAQDLDAHSIDTFHVKSLQDIIAYSQTGNGSTCAVSTPTGNTPPTVAVVGGPSFNVPKQTPFTLTASATDPDGDTITYDWQEFDLGASTTAVPNTDSDGARPIFRVYPATTSPSRTFPTMQYVLGNASIPPSTTGRFLTGELMPSIARTMNFQVIARDNRANGGGINTTTATVMVDSASGPFAVTSPNAADTWFAGQTRAITWAVNNTNTSPVNVANVKISLSTDGGQTFPTVIAASAPNNGSFNLTVPAINSTQARVKVEAVGNIFFDIGDTNFSISASAQSSGVIIGRLTTATGVGLPKIIVALNGPSGTQFAMTNGFGYYRFDTVPFGQNYTITPQPRKHYTFSPASSSFSLNADVTNADFTGQFN